jgi:hypothetical protein
VTNVVIYQSIDMRLLWRLTFGLFVLACAAAADQQCHQPNTYCFLETKYLCPAHSSSSAGADEASDCVCMAGYYLHADDDGVCVQCEAGYYCPGGLTQQRLQCPPNSISPSASSHADMCVCVAGYTEQSDSCVACADGSIKTIPGNGPCTLCGPNEYSVSTLLCDSCPSLTQSSAGSASLASCVSVPGAYEDETGTMHFCPPSTYQNEANQTSCKACEHDTYQPVYGATQASVGFDGNSSLFAGVRSVCARLLPQRDACSRLGQSGVSDLRVQPTMLEDFDADVTDGLPEEHKCLCVRLWVREWYHV